MNIRKLNLFFVTAVFGATMVFNPAFAKSDKANVRAGLSAQNSVVVNADASTSLPSGILHAPGIEKRIESGKGLPPGLLKRFFGGGDNPDRIAPVIENFQVVEVTSNSAVAEIRTNEATKVKVFVSSSSPLVEASSLVYLDNNLSTNHRVTLSNLSASTTYYVMVKASDGSGNKTVSATVSFKTLVSPADVTAPVITHVAASGISSSSATIVVRSNEEVSADLYVSAVSPLVEASSSVYSHTTLDDEHRFVLTGLSSSTSYYFIVRIKDSAGNSAVSAQKSFKTEPVDTTAPSILGPFEISVNQNSAVLIWFTPEKSDSRVWFSTSSTIDTSAAASVLVDNDVLLHSVTLTGLQASTTYHYVVGSADASGNTAISSQGSFITKM